MIKWQNIKGKEYVQGINKNTLISELGFGIRLENSLCHYFGSKANIEELLTYIDGNPNRIREIRNVGKESQKEFEDFIRVFFELNPIGS